MLLNYVNNVQDYVPSGLLRILLVMLTVCHGAAGSAQISRVITFEEDSDNIYFIEEVPLPSTLQGFDAISIFQDRKGFMWFGGESVLLRYDGSHIREYRFDPNDPHSVVLSRINTILQDSAGTIWLGTFRGLISLDPVSNTFSQFLYTGDPKNELDWNKINEMFIEGYQIWMVTHEGLCMFDTRTGKFDRHHRVVSPKSTGMESWSLTAFRLNEDTILFRHDLQLYLFDKTTDSVHIVPGSPPGYSPPSVNSKGEVLMPSWQGMHRYSPGEGRFEKLPLGYNELVYNNLGIYVVIEGSDGYYWLNSDRGLGRFSNAWDLCKFWEYDFELILQDVIQDQLWAMFMDRSGTIWFSTPGKINRIIQKPRIFNCDQRGILNKYLYHLSVNDSSLWFTDGLHIYNIFHDRSVHRQYRIVADENNEAYLPSITCFLFDRKDVLWVGTQFKGLYCCDNIHSAKPSFINPYPGTGKAKAIAGPYITRIYEDSPGRLWFGSEMNWPCFYEPGSGQFYHIQYERIREGFPGEVKVEAELGNGRYLASTNEGALIFSLPDDYFLYDTILISDYDNYPVKNKGTERTIYPEQLLKTIGADGQIHVYMVSYEGGIQGFVFDPNRKKGERLTMDMEINTNDGLITDIFWSIVEDKNGILWFGSEDGLVRLDPVHGSFTTYTRNQGLEFDEFPRRSAITGPDGRVFIGTDFGLLSFDPDSVILNKTVPPVFVTDVKVNGTSILEDSLASVSYFNHNKFRFNYKQSNLSFNFAALNYIHPERNHFKIMLEGYDESWLPVGNESMFSYFNLRPGTYSFHVIGSNNDDVWNMTGDRFDFVIKKPPWFTWGAWLIYIVILSIIFIIYYRYVQYRAKHRMEIEKERIDKESIAEVDEMKSRFFTKISHEFRTPLTLIMSHMRDLERQHGEEVKIKRTSLTMLGRNARRLLLLINQLLDIAKLEKNVLQLNLKKADLSEWIRALVSSFQSLADSQHIRFNSEIEDPGKKVCFDPDKIEKIVTNLLSNAFKFTKKGGSIVFKLHYFIKQDQDQEYIEIEVYDTGRGIEKEQLSRIFDRFYQVSSSDTRDAEGSGIGLSLTRELVELMYGTINVESIPGEGTRFLVTIPVSEKCFPGEQFSEVDTDEFMYASAMQDEQVTGELVGKERDPGDKIILIVEDNPDLRKYIIEQFSGSYQVLAASQGKQGLEQARKYLPDLVISDLMMPVMGGVELTKRLKSDPVTNHIPVIMLTAKADKTSKIEGLETGADDYIIKPFDSEELIVRAGNLIRQRDQLRNKFTRDYLIDENKEGSFSQYKMLKEILEVIDHHLEYPEFNLSSFGKELGMTRSQLFRKIHSIAGTTPNELLKIVRMKRAAYLFRTTDMNVTQVTYEVGMKNPSHFAKSFKKYFGVNPAKYRH